MIVEVKKEKREVNMPVLYNIHIKKFNHIIVTRIGINITLLFRNRTATTTTTKLSTATCTHVIHIL